MNTPHIKWVQDINHVYITILNCIKNKENIRVSIRDDFTIRYTDNQYLFEAKLAYPYFIKTMYFVNNNYCIQLKKKENITWTSLLDDKKKYKPYITIDWADWNDLEESECEKFKFESENELDNKIENLEKIKLDNVKVI